MAKDKKSFIAYADWIETFEECTDEEAGRLVKHLFRYVNDQNPEPPDRITKMLFLSMKRALKADLKKYDEIKRKRIEAGRKGGKQTQANQANASFDKQTQANQAVSVTDTVTDTVTEISKNGKQEKHTPVYFQNSELNEVFLKWLYACEHEVEVTKRKARGASAVEALAMKLNRMPVKNAIRQVRQSLENNWVNLQPLDESKPTDGEPTVVTFKPRRPTI